MIIFHNLYLIRSNTILIVSVGTPTSTGLFGLRCKQKQQFLFCCIPHEIAAQGVFAVNKTKKTDNLKDYNSKPHRSTIIHYFKKKVESETSPTNKGYTFLQQNLCYFSYSYLIYQSAHDTPVLSRDP